MAQKKNRKDKQLSALRREVELLRRQVGVTLSTPAESQTKLLEEKIIPAEKRESPLVFEARYLKADLRRTGVLTFVCLGIVGVLATTQPRWPQYYSTASQKLSQILHK